MFRSHLRYLIFSGLLLTMALPVHAAILPDCNPVPVPPDPNFVGPPVGTCGAKDLLQLLVNIYDFLMGLAGIVALLVIAFAGVRMTFYWLSEHPEEDLKAARYTMSRGVVGLIIIICAYLLVNTVIIVLTGDRLDIQKILGIFP